MAATLTATARQGETLDALIFRVLGADASAVGTVMTMNRGLAELGPILPEGTEVTLPAPSDTPAKIRETVQLWS